MLTPGPQGVELVKDWAPEYIGRSLPASRAKSTPDCCRVQQALLYRSPTAMPAARPVPMLDTVERLVDFLRGIPQPLRSNK